MSDISLNIHRVKRITIEKPINLETCYVRHIIIENFNGTEIEITCFNKSVCNLDVKLEE